MTHVAADAQDELFKRVEVRLDGVEPGGVRRGPFHILLPGVSPDGPEALCVRLPLCAGPVAGVPPQPEGQQGGRRHQPGAPQVLGHTTATPGKTPFEAICLVLRAPTRQTRTGKRPGF